MAIGDDIQERLVRLGVRVMDLCDDLPFTIAGKHIAGQLLRSGTSGARNYAEARGDESPSDFIHKLGILLKELNETEICACPPVENHLWQAGLEMLRIQGMIPETTIAPVHH